MHCNKFAAKAVGWFKPERMVMHTLREGKYLNKLEKHILGSLILLNLQHLQPQLTQLRSQPSYIWFTVESKVWVSFSRITFQSLHEEIAKYYCIASSFHNTFYLLHDEVHNEANTCTT